MYTPIRSVPDVANAGNLSDVANPDDLLDVQQLLLDEC
jgi:hypothetical protein